VTLRAALLALVMLAGGCGPAVMWSGRTADRKHRLEVVERAGLSYVIIDGQRRAAYHGVAGWSIALAGDHVAFAARVDKRWSVVVDGRAGVLWDEIGGIELMPSGTPVYLAANGGGWHVVVGDRVGPRFDAILAGTLRIVNGHVAYAGRHRGRVQVVHDDVLHPAFDGVGQLELSADGTRSIYAARRGELAHVVVDRAVGPAWGAVSRLTLGPGDHWAHAASEGDGWRLVVDNKVGPVVDVIRRITFRDDGEHVAWTAQLVAGLDVLCVDDAPIAPLSDPARFALRPASPDGALGLAYVIDAGSGEQVVVDDRKEHAYDAIGALAWSQTGRLAYTARRGSSWFVVVDGHELWGGDHVSAPIFSDDGRRLGFVAVRGKGTYVVVDDATHRFDLAFDDSLVFSPDSAHWAVIAGEVAREQLFIAIDGDRERITLPAREIYSAATAHDPRVLRAWTAAELARRTF
jgi:hypothetical protein